MLDGNAFADLGVHKKARFCAPARVHRAGVELSQFRPRVRPVCEFAGYFLLNAQNINRTDYNDFDPLGAIPFFVEGTHPLRRCRFEYFLLADRIAGCEIGVGVKQVIGCPGTLKSEILPLALFRNDNPALPIDRTFVEKNFACGFPHQKQRTFKQGRIGAGEVELILCLRITG